MWTVLVDCGPLMLCCVPPWPSSPAPHQGGLPCILNNFLHTTRQGWHTAEIIQITKVSNGFRSQSIYFSATVMNIGDRLVWAWAWESWEVINYSTTANCRETCPAYLPVNLPYFYLPYLPYLFCEVCNAYTYTGSVVNIGSDKWHNKFKIQSKITFKGIPWEIVFFYGKDDKIYFCDCG